MITKIDGKEFTRNEINQWKYGRIKNALKLLEVEQDIPADVSAAMDMLTEVKLALGPDNIERKLEKAVKSSEKSTKMLAKLSRGKRSFSVVEIFVDGMSAERAAYWVNEINLNSQNDKTYERVNLAACPDHFVLRATGENSLEVIECTGDMKSPSQFFINYGDETGLKTPRDKSYPYQSVGVAKTSDGVLIGGVRHQFKDTDTGFRVRLSVEFPKLVPGSVIKSHRKHMATEFNYWLQWIVDNKK